MLMTGSCSSPAVNNHHCLDGGDKASCGGEKGVEWVVSMSPGVASRVANLGYTSLASPLLNIQNFSDK